MKPPVTGSVLRSLLPVLALLCVAVACDGSGTGKGAPVVAADRQARDAGYSVLHRMLSDERHLDTLRLAKDLLALRASVGQTKTLVDDIAAGAAAELDELDRLVSLEPRINIADGQSGDLGRAVFDALRATTAKELLLSAGDDFELRLVISQTQALRLVSHLARALSAHDPNSARKAWLEQLAVRFDELHGRAVARLALVGGG